MFGADPIRCRRTRYALAAALTVLPLALGCASPGQPRPPALNLPNRAENLSAARMGDRITLTWKTPATTTDGPAIKGPVTAVVCLDASPSATASAARPSRKSKRPVPLQPGAREFVCDAVQRAPISVGPSRVSVALAAGLTAGPPALIAYRIELENASGRSAGPSEPAFAVAGAAPAAGPPRVSARRDGALVQWAAMPDGATVEVTRTLVSSPAVPAAQAKSPAKTAKAPGSGPKTPPHEIVLRAETAGANDPGGMVDTSVADGSSYTYTAERVRTVVLGGHTLELRGAASPAAALTYRDVFAPMPPAGLVLVPGGGFGEPPSIDLSWDANFDGDLLGYNVYRSEGGGEFLRLNAEPLAVPAFRDPRVEPGGQYAYRVTAVDQRHNESAPSATARESLRR